MHTAVLVLAGGTSRRMGTNKLLLQRDVAEGKRVVEHVLKVALRVSDDVSLLGPEALSDNLVGDVGRRIRVIPDRVAEQGPLHALAEAWPGLGADLVLLLAGDLPGITPTVLETCRQLVLAGPPHLDGAVVIRQGRLQPLLGCYRQRAGQVFSDLVAQGGVRLMPALAKLQLEPVVAESYDWVDWMTRPIHTPQDYAQWLERTGDAN